MAALVDQFGREIVPEYRRKPDLRDITVARVMDRWSSYPSSGLTPERLAQVFREADNGDVLRQAELFEEMEEKDPHLASQLQVRKLAVQGLEYEVLPGGEDARAVKIADFCREALAGLSDWDDHILDMLDAVAKGFSIQEILWDVSGGEVRVRGLRWVHCKKITFRDSMTPSILTEEEPFRGVEPPPFKILYHRYRARSGYDTRAGMLRVCAWMYLFKNYAIKDWISFAELYGMPLRLGVYEPGASPDDKAALLDAVRSLGTDAAGIVSKNTEVRFIEAQKSGSVNVYDTLANFCDAQVSKAILGQTLTSEAGGRSGTGSYALGTVHAGVRRDLVTADSKSLARTINHQLLRPLVGFNFGWDAPAPKLRFLDQQPEDLETLARVYTSLREMGFDISQEHVSHRFKVPMRKPEQTALGQEGG